MIVQKKKNLSKLIKMAIVFAAVFSISIHFAVSASDTANNYTSLVIACTSSDGENMDNPVVGAILNWEGTAYIVCGDITGGPIYAFTDGNVFYQMEACDNPTGIQDGLNWFTPSESIGCTPAPVTQGALGEEYFVLYSNSDFKGETGRITIDECKECGNIYQATQANASIGAGFYPMLIEDESGGIIGYIPSEGAALLFEKPAGANGSSSSGDGNGGSASDGSNGGTSSDDRPSSNDDRLKSVIIIAIVVILALAGASYYKKQKSGRSSPAPKPVQDSEPTPIPAPEPVQPPSPAPAPIPAPAPTPIPQPVNDQSKGWFIQMDGGVMNGFLYPVHSGILIGRNPECNVRYPADTKGVSRKHCKIFVNNNNLFVMDLGSTSGTFLRGAGQLTPNVPQSIRSGDIIYLGEKKNGIVVRYNQ